MTREEFDNTQFTGQMNFKVLKNGNVYELVAVAFGEALIALDDCNDIDNPTWYRCESVELV